MKESIDDLLKKDKEVNHLLQGESTKTKIKMNQKNKDDEQIIKAINDRLDNTRDKIKRMAEKSEKENKKFETGISKQKKGLDEVENYLVK